MSFLSNITFRALRPQSVLASLLLLLLSACGGTTPIQPPPPPPDLALRCPSSLTQEATNPQGAEVHFDAASATGGREPYAIECNPGSGSNFAIGDTSVQCKVVDADMKQAACGFTVTVRISKTLSRTRFTAFGDSITDGVVSLVPLLRFALPDTYPFKLEQMLLERYPSQTFIVSNQGKPGEKTTEGALRLPGVLDAEKPQVVLLLEGVNAVKALSTSSQVAALRTMIIASQARNVEVIIATLMPISPQRESAHPGTEAKIEALNARIVQLAGEFNLGPVVDLFAIFASNLQLLGSDGLHPTLEGQTRIAEAFRDEIVRRYDTTLSTMAPPFSTMKVAQ